MLNYAAPASGGMSCIPRRHRAQGRENTCSMNNVPPPAFWIDTAFSEERKQASLKYLPTASPLPRRARVALVEHQILRNIKFLSIDTLYRMFE